MTAIELISLIASIASLILAVGAIWLSIVFFRMSNEASKATTEAAKGIDASVQRLEKLFDKLYSDTFSMMKDTVTDMRRHIWNKPELENKEVSEELREEIKNQVLSALNDQLSSGADKEKIAEKLESAFEEILVKARNKKRSVKSERIFNTIKNLGPITVDKLTSMLEADVKDIAPAVFSLRGENKITWDGPEGMLSSDSILEIARDEN